MNRVFTVVDGTARLHLVRTGMMEYGYTQVVSGLEANTVIIINPESNLRDGQPVVIKK
jgi:hypothetical protein